jgi:plasmid replication initiation protein
MNSEIHSINTRYNSDFRRPLINWTTYKNGTYYTGIKVFNYLPTLIINLSHNIKQFTLALRDFLYLHSFYTLEEFL